MAERIILCTILYNVDYFSQNSSFRHNVDSKLVELLCEPSGESENFIRMSLSDFEYLLMKM